MIKVFSHAGYIGINAVNEETGKVDNGIINDWDQPNQMGCVALFDQVEFTSEAVTLLKQITNSKDAIGDIMLFASEYEGNPAKCFAWMSGPRTMLKIDPDKQQGDRDYNPALLDEATINDKIEIPTEFKEAVDSYIAEEALADAALDANKTIQ